jgi:hypothetical protein
MTRKQKREPHAMKVEIERLNAELAKQDGVLSTLPSTNADNVTEDAISPQHHWRRESTQIQIYQRLVLPTTLTLQRESSPTVSLSKGVESDTVLAETIPPTNTNVTKRAISSTASLSQRVYPDTAQTETGPQNQVNSSELTTEGVTPMKAVPTKNNASTEEFTPPTDQSTPRVETGTDQSNLESLKNAAPTEDINPSTVLASP